MPWHNKKVESKFWLKLKYKITIWVDYLYLYLVREVWRDLTSIKSFKI